jgi:hypothetical protein
MELWQEILLLSCLSLVGGAIGGIVTISMSARSEIRRRMEREKYLQTLRRISDEAPKKD